MIIQYQIDSEFVMVLDLRISGTFFAVQMVLLLWRRTHEIKGIQEGLESKQ